jgi:hypothetical protein
LRVCTERVTGRRAKTPSDPEISNRSCINVLPWESMKQVVDGVGDIAVGLLQLLL